MFEICTVHTTSSPGFEIERPWGYMKGRRPETLAFLRSRASSGNELRRGQSHRALGRKIGRDSYRPNFAGHQGPFSAKTLASLGLSRRPGYRLLRALNRSQPFRFLPPTSRRPLTSHVKSFGHLPPVQSTTAPTASWHFDCRHVKMAFVAPGIAVFSTQCQEPKEFWTRPGPLAGGFAEMRLPERRKWAELRATR